MTPEALEHLCERDPTRPRLLILNYPGNSTGMCYSPEQMEAIARVARKYRVLLLSDEIYGGVHFEGERVSIARFYPEGTIISNGLSKWCGGRRMAPGRLRFSWHAELAYGRHGGGGQRDLYLHQRAHPVRGSSRL